MAPMTVVLLVLVVSVCTVSAAKFSTCDTGITNLKMTTPQESLPLRCQPKDDAFLMGLFECLKDLRANVTDCEMVASPTTPFVVATNSTGASTTVNCSTISLRGPVIDESLVYDFVFSLYGLPELDCYPDAVPFAPRPSVHRSGDSVFIDWDGHCEYEYKIVDGDAFLKPTWTTCDLPATSYTLTNEASLGAACTGTQQDTPQDPAARAIFQCLKNVEISTQTCKANVTGLGRVTVDGMEFDCTAFSALGDLTEEKVAGFMVWNADTPGQGVVADDAPSNNLIRSAWNLPQQWPTVFKRRPYGNLKLGAEGSVMLTFAEDCVLEYKAAGPLELGQDNAAVSAS